MAALRLARAAARLVKALGGECAIVGGLAVNAYGYVRATRDVDVIVPFSLADARRRLAAAGVPARLFRGDILGGGFDCLRGMLGDVPFDVLPQLVPFEAGRRVVIELEPSLKLPIVDFQTLVRLKLRAAGPKDLLDLAVLVNLQPERKTEVLQMAAYDPETQQTLSAYIDDPRVKRDAVARRPGSTGRRGATRSRRKAR